MAKEKFRKQSGISADPFMDFEFSREAHGTGICKYSLDKTLMPSGEIVVAGLYQREGNEVVDTPLGFKRVCVTDVGIEGYRVYQRTFLDPFALEPRLKRIPEEDRPEIERILREKYSNLDGRKLDQIYFEPEFEL
jgi:hypothetical protein